MTVEQKNFVRLIYNGFKKPRVRVGDPLNTINLKAAIGLGLIQMFFENGERWVFATTDFMMTRPKDEAPIISIPSVKERGRIEFSLDGQLTPKLLCAFLLPHGITVVRAEGGR